MYHRARVPFRHYIHDPLDANSLSDAAVHAIYQDRNGILWLGTVTGGLNRLDPESGQFTHYRHNPADPHSLSGDSLYAIYEDHTGALWVGTYSGLNRLDPATQQFTRYVHDPDDPTSLSHNFVRAITEDMQGNLWVGTMRGLDRFDRATHQFEHYGLDPADPQSLRREDILTLWFDRENTLWVGTTDAGLSRFDLQNNTWRHYRHDPGDPASLSHDSVYAFYEDSVGRVWVGTAGGLNRLDRETGHCVRYMQQDGLPSDTIVGILEEIAPGEAGGYLWLSTLNGLSRFNPRTETFKNYDRSDGLVNDAYYYFSYHRTQDGELWFGGQHGIDVVDPSRITENAYVPPVVLTNFEINNQPVAIGGDAVMSQSITTLDTLTLSHLDRVLAFEFAALNYVNPAKNRYAYKLEGFDDAWVETTSERRRATYTNLDHGTYVFRVRGSNNDGLWNDKGVSLAITITPAWWETWWFYTLCGCGVLGVFGLVYWNKVNQLRRERTMAAALQESETKYRVLFASFPLGITVSDPSGNILEANAMSEKLLGVTQEEQRQRPLDGQAWDIIRPDGTPMPATNYASVRALRGNCRIEHVEMGIVKTQDEVTWIDVTAAPIPLESYGVVVTYSDITERKQTEAMLRESEERFKLLFDNSTDAHVLYQADQFIECNQATLDMFGFSDKKQLLTLHPGDISPPYQPDAQLSREKADAMVAIAFDKGSHRFEWLCQRADGSELLLDVLLNVIRIKGDALIHAVWRDITDRKRAEDALRQSEERFRAVWETSADAMALSDPDGIVLATNPAYLQLYGYAEEDVVGNTFAIIFPEEQRQWAMEQYRSIFAALDILPAFESTIQRPDGTTRIVESRVGFLSNEGQRYAMLSSIRDITDRKQMEETLQRMNERFALATRAAHLGVWDWDIQKNELIWDDRMYELYGIKREDFSGAYEAWLQGVHPDDAPRSHAEVEQAQRGEKAFDTEFRIVRPDGDVRWLRAYAQVTWDEAGHPLRMTGINYDITERKQAEERLKTSLAEKNVLIRELYHRTKNTLQVIHSMLVLQAAGMSDNDQVQKLVQDMENRIMTIALVHKKLYQVQDLSRLNISEYLQELAQFILQSYHAPSDKISLTFNIEAIPMLFDVVIPCGLVVNELLSNAVKYAFPDGRDGEIAIKLFRNESGKLELHVADNGVGVPPGFDFRRQDTLGLQTVVALAEHQMQGTIRFSGDDGVKCVVEFPDTLYTERV